MHYSALVLPLTLALTAAGEPLQSLPNGLSYARQHRREAHDLSARQLELDPQDVCGEGYSDCQETPGFCCPSGSTCAGTFGPFDLPICKDPSVTTGLLKGTSPAIAYEDPGAVIDSIQSLLASMTADPFQTGAATTAATTVATTVATIKSTTAGSSSQGTGQAANTQAQTQTQTQETGQAANTQTQSPGSAAGALHAGFGSAAIVAIGAWGTAALVGAGWFMM